MILIENIPTQFVRGQEYYSCFRPCFTTPSNRPRLYLGICLPNHYYLQKIDPLQIHSVAQNLIMVPNLRVLQSVLCNSYWQVLEFTGFSKEKCSRWWDECFGVRFSKVFLVNRIEAESVLITFEDVGNPLLWTINNAHISIHWFKDVLLFPRNLLILYMKGWNKDV